VARLAARAARHEWLGERTHEGFGRFRIDSSLPGVTNETSASSAKALRADAPEEAIAAKTQEWFNAHRSLAKLSGSDRKPSLSQWLDLVGELEAHSPGAIKNRLTSTTAGGRSWRHRDAAAVLAQLEAVKPEQRARHARLFVRWLRAALREEAR
jgi:hypothetical protein